MEHLSITAGGCLDRVARSGSYRDNVRGVVGTMNAARSRPDWLATVQSGRKQAQSRVCTPGFRYQSITTAVIHNACLNTRWHHGAYTCISPKEDSLRESLGMGHVVTMCVVQSAQ